MKNPPGGAAVLLLAGLAACGGAPVPEISTEGMEPAVRTAVESALRAVEGNRNSAARWGRLGMVLHAHRLAGPARAAYAEAARQDTEDHRWPHLEGRLVEAADPAAALTRADEAVSRNPSFSPSLALRARVLDALGRPSEANRAWGELLRVDPDSVEANLARGRSLLHGGDLDGARTALERVVAERPASEAGWAFLARLYRRVGDGRLAEAAAARARAAAASPTHGASADPDPLLLSVEDLRADSRGREARARRAAASGDHAAAVAIYQRLAAERPEEAELHYNLGNALTRQGDDGAAEAAYRASLARDPTSSPAMANLANLLARHGRDSEAAALYRESAAADPEHIPTLLGASSLHFQEGSLREAERLLRQVLALDPTHPAALQGLGQLLATAGNPAGAADALERALAVAEESGAPAARRAELHFLLADVARRRGRADEALAHLRRAEALGMEIPAAFREGLRGR